MNVRRGLRRFTAAAGTVLLLVVSDATSARAAASGP